ncbi:polyprenyl synthetase family protein [Candidatus Woesearchaeota archaeon]|nr:polyprenyl synthetase family protein [Candidatus Woesearchaeota archaeon]
MESNLQVKNLEELYSIFTNRFNKEVKPYIEEIFPRNKHTEPVYYILDNFILRRFRSGLPLVMAELLNVEKEYIMPIAAASELMFAIALVQDDFFDNSEVRGNIPSAHIKYGSRVAMASCDYSYCYVLKILQEIEKFDIPKPLAKKIYLSFLEIQEKVFTSFLVELLNNKSLDFSQDDVLELHRNKTIHGVNTIYCASLIFDNMLHSSFSENLKEYSIQLAIAGQIKNDIYDLTRYAESRGYTDILNGYLTYPLAILIKNLNSEERVKLVKFFSEESIKEIVQLMNQKQIIEKCVVDGIKHAQMGIDLIPKEFNNTLTNIMKLWAEGNKVNKDSAFLTQK